MILYLQPSFNALLMKMMSAAQFYDFRLVNHLPFLHYSIQTYRAFPQRISYTVLYCTCITDSVNVAV